MQNFTQNSQNQIVEQRQAFSLLDKDETHSYRMVNKSYYCYECERKYKKMMTVSDLEQNGITCEHCNNNICELIESDSGIDEFLNNQPASNNNAPSQARENIQDTFMETDQFGRPLSRGSNQSNMRNSPPASPPNNNIRVINPFGPMFSQQFGNFDSIFNNDPFLNFNNGSDFAQGYQQNFRSNHQAQQSARQQPQGMGTMSFTIINNGMPVFGQAGVSNDMDFGFESFADLINQHMQRMQGENGQQQRQGTPESVINSLPVQKIEDKHCKKDCNGKLEAPTCSVCITDFEKGEEGMFLPCGHAFHPDCIKPWLKNNDKCPVCRKELPKN